MSFFLEIQEKKQAEGQTGEGGRTRRESSVEEPSLGYPSHGDWHGTDRG